MRKDLPATDFGQLGFKCGLEIHQQLDTRKKLFCHCPVGLRAEPPDATLLRHMRPTLSELGEYDGTALMEFKTKKNVIYQLNSGSTCTYEMDDTPPFELNQQALDIAIEIAMLFHCSIVDEIHISRKQYLDGSIPTGFQRTTVVGIEGWVPYRGRKIRILQVNLEEDACREISDIGHTVTFKADRLSTPLVEIITYPDMLDPQEAMEVDEILGRVLKASGKVRRGIGSVRQDVNVSIEGGTRVELKGIERTGYIRDLTYVEALRQKALLEIRSAIQARGISRKSLTVDKYDLSQALAGTQSASIRSALDSGGKVKCAKIGGFAGLLNYAIQPGLTFAWEFSGRVKVIACIDKRPNLFHSDDIEGSELTVAEWNTIKQITKSKLTDTIIVVWGSNGDVETALDEIKFRALDAVKGVPNETRQDIGDGVTDFERILPGADRMYPDTDSPPMALTADRLDRIRAQMAERSYEREERWQKLGVREDIIKPLATSPKAVLFDKIISNNQINPNLVGTVLTQILKSLQRKGYAVNRIADDTLAELFDHHSLGKFAREAFPDILKKLCESSGNPALADILASYTCCTTSDEQLRKIVLAELDKTKNTRFASDDKRFRYLMGQIMAELRGKVAGARVAEMLMETHA